FCPQLFDACAQLDGFRCLFLLVNGGLAQAVARSRNREALTVQQLTDTPDQQDFMMLVITPVTATFDRLELRELLFPVAQHVRLHPAQVADLADREVALRRDRRQRLLIVLRMAAVHCPTAPRLP